MNQVGRRSYLDTQKRDALIKLAISVKLPKPLARNLSNSELKRFLLSEGNKVEAFQALSHNSIALKT